MGVLFGFIKSSKRVSSIPERSCGYGQKEHIDTSCFSISEPARLCDNGTLTFYFTPSRASVQRLPGLRERRMRRSSDLVTLTVVQLS
eukprot:IDg22224t1